MALGDNMPTEKAGQFVGGERFFVEFAMNR
jgi:hypothetical protein